MSYTEVLTKTKENNTTLVAVSKTKPASMVLDMYNRGQRHFGENRVQEMVDKYETLPKDIKWHQIGSLQRNKVKYIAPFVHLIHSVDSLRLASMIIKEAIKVDRCIDILIQVKVAMEDTKHGMDSRESLGLIRQIKELKSPNICLRGMMAMASFTIDQEILKAEFDVARTLFDKAKKLHFQDDVHWDTLSMGMSGDYELAMAHGSNMVRVGSLIFGRR